MNQARHIDVDTLNAYIDDAVPDPERAKIARHLTECQTCRREFHELRAISLLYAGLPQFAPRRAFTLGAEHLRPVAIPRVVQILPVLRTLAIAAVLVFVLLSAFAVINTNQSSASSPNPGAPAQQSRAALMAPASTNAGAPAATQVTRNQAQSVAPPAASEGARAAKASTASGIQHANAIDDRTLSGWWIASFIVGLGMALLLLAWFALDRGGARRPLRS